MHYFYVTPTGLEPATSSLTGKRALQLLHEAINCYVGIVGFEPTTFCVSDRHSNRTELYPIELRAGDATRTRNLCVPNATDYQFSYTHNKYFKSLLTCRPRKNRTLNNRFGICCVTTTLVTHSLLRTPPRIRTWSLLVQSQSQLPIVLEAYKSVTSHISCYRFTNHTKLIRWCQVLVNLHHRTNLPLLDTDNLCNED